MWRVVLTEQGIAYSSELQAEQNTYAMLHTQTPADIGPQKEGMLLKSKSQEKNNIPYFFGVRNNIQRLLRARNINNSQAYSSTKRIISTQSEFDISKEGTNQWQQNQQHKQAKFLPTLEASTRLTTTRQRSIRNDNSLIVQQHKERQQEKRMLLAAQHIQQSEELLRSARQEKQEKADRPTYFFQGFIKQMHHSPLTELTLAQQAQREREKIRVAEVQRAKYRRFWKRLKIPGSLNQKKRLEDSEKTTEEQMG